MSTTIDLVLALKNELKNARMTYADLATVARAWPNPASSECWPRATCRCRASTPSAARLKIDFAELARRVADAQPLLKELTHEQEKAVVKDKKLLLVAISVLSQWTLEQIVAAYRISEAECIGLPGPAGPHRHHRAAPAQPVSPEARQDLPLAPARAGDGVLPRERGARLLPRRLRRPGRGACCWCTARSAARWRRPSWTRLQRVAQDFAQQHQTDQKLSAKDREGYTLLLGMRNWEFELVHAACAEPEARSGLGGFERVARGCARRCAAASAKSSPDEA